MGFRTPAGYNNCAAVTIPDGYHPVQLIPATAYQGESSFGRGGRYFGWDFVSPQVVSSVSMDFESSLVVQSYQDMLFNGGLWIGIGASTTLAALFELGRYYYDASKTNELLAVTNVPKDQAPW